MQPMTNPPAHVFRVYETIIRDRYWRALYVGRSLTDAQAALVTRFSGKATWEYATYARPHNEGVIAGYELFINGVEVNAVVLEHRLTYDLLETMGKRCRDALGWCDCGGYAAQDALEQMTAALLAHVDDRDEAQIERGVRDFDWQAWDARAIEIAGSEGALMFIWYLLDHMGVMEHGGSVPGWLTDKGRDVLSTLQVLNADAEILDSPPEDA